MSKPESARYLGTFAGVFVPNVLTILGVIMYLRMGWVVGNAGLQDALLILAIAQTITLTTALSMSAVATNMKMKGGGAYFMISRAFGVEAGGAIGIPLYIAQAVGISLYVVGFADSVCTLYPQLDPTLTGLVALVLITVLALAGSRHIIRMQFIILAAIALSLFSFFAGRPPDLSAPVTGPAYSPGHNFWTVFAVFFPAVTGILSGVSMSGDLKEPHKSIPRGTLWSVGVGAVIYMAIVLWFSVAASREELIGDYTIMKQMALFSPLIYGGIWGATISSAAANILAAPRTLQALAADRVVLKRLRSGRGPNNEPVGAVIITFALAAITITLGDLNIIASVLTMFFLITYGSINLISFVEVVIRRPSYRPTFKVHWLVSFTGAAGCIAVMIIISPMACAAGFGFVGLVYVMMQRANLKSNWGDVRTGIWTQFVQFGLEQLERLAVHHKNWRPYILVFGKKSRATPAMARLAYALTRGRGFVTFIDLVGEENLAEASGDSLEIKRMLDTEGITGFSKVALAENIRTAQIVAAQVHGIGQFRQNTVMMEWSTETAGRWNIFGGDDMARQFKILSLYKELGLSLIFLHLPEVGFNTGRKKICVWWDPTQGNGSFMLLLAHLISTSPNWKGSVVHLKTVAHQDNADQAAELLHNLVRQSRIEATVKVHAPLENDDNIFAESQTSPVAEDAPEPETDTGQVQEAVIKEKLGEQIVGRDKSNLSPDRVRSIIALNSVDADLVLLGFNIPVSGKEKSYIKKMNALLQDMPPSLLVNAAFDFNLFE